MTKSNRSTADSREFLCAKQAIHEHTLSACVPALIVLESQLARTQEKIEESVLQVCQNFSNIARRTGENARQMGRLAGDEGGKKQDLLAGPLDALENLLLRLDQADRIFQQTATDLQRITHIAEQVNAIDSSLTEVDQISFGLHILALNAKMEAARAGHEGRTFGAVAGETGLLARRIATVAKSIRQQVSSLQELVELSAHQIEKRLAAYSKEAAQVREQAHMALGVLRQTHEQMRQMMRDSAANATELADDLSSAVTTLQFQDAVNQQLQHVGSALQEIRESLNSYVKHHRLPEPPDSWADDLEARYTMLAEREVLAELTGKQVNHHGDSAPGSIELF